MIELGEMPPWFYRGLATILGLLWGSFLNVVIYRGPRGMSVVRPASRCPACGKEIEAWRNIPLVSWVLLRGKAACCGVPVSPRYPLVEAIGGLLGWAIVEKLVLTLPPSTSLLHAGAVFVSAFTLALALVAATFIDLEHMYIPDLVTIGGTVLGIATFSLRQPPLSLLDAVVGAVAGFAIIWLPFGLLYRLIRGRTGMGMGDAKLVMLAGGWFGWPGAIFVLMAGAVQGTIGALVLLLVRGKIEEPEAVQREREEAMRELEALPPEERANAEKQLAEDPLFEDLPDGVTHARMAFGPFLALAILEYLLVGPELYPWLQGWFAVF